MGRQALKPIEWIKNSRKLLKEFPFEARHQAGFELFRIQQGAFLADWKPMPTVGPGAFEIRIHTPQEYRVVNVAKFSEAIYVLHCFNKKTKKTDRKDIELSRRAYAEVQKIRKEKQFSQSGT